MGRKVIFSNSKVFHFHSVFQIHYWKYVLWLSFICNRRLRILRIWFLKSLNFRQFCVDHSNLNLSSHLIHKASWIHMDDPILAKKIIASVHLWRDLIELVFLSSLLYSYGIYKNHHGHFCVLESNSLFINTCSMSRRSFIPKYLF